MIGFLNNFQNVSRVIISVTGRASVLYKMVNQLAIVMMVLVAKHVNVHLAGLEMIVINHVSDILIQ